MDLRTDFARPHQTLIEHLVSAALASAHTQVDRCDWEWIESGSSSLVVLAGRVAVRVARDRHATAGLMRAQQLVDALPDLPFGVPRSVGEAVDIEGHIAVPTVRLQGRAHPARHGDPRALRNLLEAVHQIPLTGLLPHLAPARAFCGGDRWEAVLREQVTPALPCDVRAEATLRIEALAHLNSPHFVVNHGDLAGSNVLWHEGEVSGVLDWDLTSEEDPAEDVAALVAWHGWHLLEQVVDPHTAFRADVFRRSFPLQLVAFTLLRNRPLAELNRNVLQAAEMLRT